MSTPVFIVCALSTGVIGFALYDIGYPALAMAAVGGLSYLAGCYREAGRKT